MSFHAINIYTDGETKVTDGLFSNFDEHVKLKKTYQIGQGEYSNISSAQDEPVIFGTPIMRSSGLKMWDSNNNRPQNITVQMDFYGSQTDESESFKDGLRKFEECIKERLVRDSTSIFKNGKGISTAALESKWLNVIKSDIDGKYSDKIMVKLPSKLVDGETVLDLDQVEFFDSDSTELGLEDVMEKFEEKYTFDAILQPVKLNFYGKTISMPLVAVQIKFHQRPPAQKRQGTAKGLGCLSKKRQAEDAEDDEFKRVKSE